MTVRLAEKPASEAKPQRNWWTREKILAAVRDSGGSSVVAGMTVAVVARRKFGSWDEACRTVGLTPISKQKTKYARCVVDGCASAPRSGFSTYCEMHYGRLRRNGNFETLLDLAYYESCVYCDTETKGSKFCGARCRARHDRGNPGYKNCIVCGNVFAPTNDGRDPSACSEHCAIENRRSVSRKYYADVLVRNPAHQEYVRSRSSLIRARKKNATIEHVNHSAVMGRDDWLCGICGDPVDSSLQWPDPGSASLDHIIPLSKGGAHSYANTQCAHLRCNLSKGARIQEAA